MPLSTIIEAPSRELTSPSKKSTPTNKKIPSKKSTPTNKKKKSEPSNNPSQKPKLTRGQTRHVFTSKKPNKNKAKNEFIKRYEKKYNIYSREKLRQPAEILNRNNNFKKMCSEQGLKPSDFDPNVKTFEELLKKYKDNFDELIVKLFNTQYINGGRKKGGKYKSKRKKTLYGKGKCMGGKKKKSTLKKRKSRSKISVKIGG
jgi:ASC-1-like (ASCH) protein